MNPSVSLLAGVVVWVCSGVLVCPLPAWEVLVGGGISARWPIAPVVFLAVCLVRAIWDVGQECGLKHGRWPGIYTKLACLSPMINTPHGILHARRRVVGGLSLGSVLGLVY